MAKFSKGEWKQRMRQESKQTVFKPRESETKTYADRMAALEKGRKDLVAKCSFEGAPKLAAIKNELEYLLRNYHPQYEARINGLIEQWRRSGDPAYSPEIKSRLRTAKMDYYKNSEPL